MSSLQQTIARLAEEFAANVLKAISSSSLSEITALGAASPGRSGTTPSRSTGAPSRRGRAAAASAPAASPAGPWRRVRKHGRRGSEDLEAVIARVVATLKAGGAMSSEQLQRALRLTKKDIARPIVLAVKRGTISKQGNKRGTRYTAA